MQERRSEIRMLCADMVEVSWKDQAGRRRRAVGLLEDISPSGACLQLETAVPLGAQILLECPKQEFIGSVQYCVYREIGYFVGLAFHDGCKWSKKAYKPQHLLDLHQLLARQRR